MCVVLKSLLNIIRQVFGVGIRNTVDTLVKKFEILDISQITSCSGTVVSWIIR